MRDNNIAKIFGEEMKKERKIESLNDAVEAIRNFTNIDVIVGSQITTPSGATIIPISKITVGLLSGEGEYGEIKLFQGNKKYPKSNGGGGLVTIKPYGFLVEKGRSVRFIACEKDVFEKAFDKIDEALNA